MNTLGSPRKAPHNKTMGIEIELIAKSYELDGKYFGFFYVGSDGSLSTIENTPINDPYGWCGIELVSQPLTYDWMKKEIVKVFKSINVPTFVNSTCGIHVHVSKKWFTDNKAKAVWKFIQTLSEEDFKHVFGRYPNNYCRVVPHYNERYHAINMTNTHTNEFRMFKSSTDPKWAQYCIDCAKYMVDHAKHLSLDGLLAFRDIHWPN